MEPSSPVWEPQLSASIDLPAGLFDLSLKSGISGTRKSLGTGATRI